MSDKVFYITTPLYYCNDAPHVGHAYATFGADVIARYQRALGREVVFTTGTDEHGQKMEKAAREKGYSGPQALADEKSKSFRDLWDDFGISYDEFIRTTSPKHVKAASDFFARVHQAGLIEKRAYRGWYCVHEENFWPEAQLKQPGNLCPDCGRPTQESEEVNYFFKQSAFKERILAHLKANPGFVAPESRRNELLGSYLEREDGVQDQSITRANFTWGVPTPVDPAQVIYVWFDALVGYLSAVGYGADDAAAKARFERAWPASVHLIGKDILRFHAVLWPAMLMAHGLPLPGQVFGTGLILNNGVKMSKSLGNAVEPREWALWYSPDVLRYYLLREVPFGSDGSISVEGYHKRYEAELANGLGNLVSRGGALCEKNGVAFDEPRDPGPNTKPDQALRQAADELKRRYLEAMDRLALHEALEAVNVLIRAANKYVDERAPWVLAKDRTPEGRKLLVHVLYQMAEASRLCLVALTPFMPGTADRGLVALGYAPGQLFDARGAARAATLGGLLEWGGLPAALKLKKGEPLFPRREPVKA